jgi:hypothetical protein
MAIESSGRPQHRSVSRLFRRAMPQNACWRRRQPPGCASARLSFDIELRLEWRPPTRVRGRHHRNDGAKRPATAPTFAWHWFIVGAVALDPRPSPSSTEGAVRRRPRAWGPPFSVRAWRPIVPTGRSAAVASTHAQPGSWIARQKRSAAIATVANLSSLGELASCKSGNSPVWSNRTTAEGVIRICAHCR